MKNSSQIVSFIMFHELLGNIKESFRYTYNNTVRRPLFWLCITLIEIAIGLSLSIFTYFFEFENYNFAIIFVIIALIISISYFGLDVKILANKELNFKGFGKTILDGFKMLLIRIIYMIIFGIIIFILNITGIFGMHIYEVVSLFDLVLEENFSLTVVSDIGSLFFSEGVTALSILSFILFIVLSFFSFLIIVLASVNFARSGKFSAGFNFPQMHTRIKKTGILKFILAVIIYGLIFFVITVVLSIIVDLIGLIPNEVVSYIISNIVVAPILPIVYFILPFKYFGNLFVD